MKYGRPLRPASAAALCCGVLMSGLFFSSAASNPGSEYGVLVYIVGSDLESKNGAASEDIKEMLSGLKSATVQVALQTGGALSWRNPLVAADPQNRWVLSGGNLVSKGAPTIMDMADADSLADFIAWGLTEIKAKKYSLILWNHGMGAAGGYGYDEKSGNSLSLRELGRSLSEGTKRGKASFELIGFDACLMATVETAAAVEPFARYMVASQEVEPSHGWDYSAFFSKLGATSGLDGAEIGRIIADTYQAQAAKSGTDSLLTVSVLDLAAIPALSIALDTAAADFQRLNAKRSAALREKTREYGDERSGRASSGMVDLIQLLQALESERGSKKTASLAAAAKAAVAYSASGKGRSGAGGISIFFPQAGRNSSVKENARYAAEGASSEAWSDYLQSYRSAIEGTSPELEFKPGLRLDTKPLKDGWSKKYNETADFSDVFTATMMASGDDVAEAGIYLSAMEELADGSVAEVVIGIDGNLKRRQADSSRLELDFEWTGEWALLEGQEIPLYLEYENEEERLFTMPATVNGLDCDINILERIEANGVDTWFEILNAVEATDEETDVPSKNIFPIKKGDKITPLFLAIDEETEEEYYVEGDSFRYKGGEIEFLKLSPGEYWITFYALNYSGDESYSDSVKLIIE